MNIEFHYWLTGIIAYKAGFSSEDSSKIAFASQYVDDNDVCYNIEDKTTKEVFGNFISQTVNITKPQKKLMRIYPIFHFIPGDYDAPSARRTDGKMHILNTTPDNEIANRYMDEAFKSSPDYRLQRIGIATHSFADTFAHQNFTGWYDMFNALGEKIVLNIGHAMAGTNPDEVNHKWNDVRLTDNKINNIERFLAAAEKIFKLYSNYLKKNNIDSDWNNLKPELEKLMTFSGDSKKRIDNYKKYCQSNNFPLADYHEKIWFEAAIHTKIVMFRDSRTEFGSMFTLFPDKYSWKENINKEETDWYKFQKAVMDQEALGISLLSDIFKQMKVDIGKT